MSHQSSQIMGVKNLFFLPILGEYQLHSSKTELGRVGNNLESVYVLPIEMMTLKYTETTTDQTVL